MRIGVSRGIIDMISTASGRLLGLLRMQVIGRLSVYALIRISVSQNYKVVSKEDATLTHLVVLQWPTSSCGIC
jgi:hypothetical protein